MTFSDRSSGVRSGVASLRAQNLRPASDRTCGPMSVELWPSLCTVASASGLPNTGLPMSTSPMKDRFLASVVARIAASLLALVLAPAGVLADPAESQAAATGSPGAAADVALRDYIIGPDDVLGIVYWRETELSADVTVRPDGKISLPLLNDIEAAGLSPEALRDRLVDASRRYVADPNVTVIVKQMNSRRVFITGEVEKPGRYPLTGPTTVLQLIAVAGGLREYADSKNIVVIRSEDGRAVSHRFNYKDVAARKNLRQNIELKPGDTIVVP
jgi:polysaccharide biosynthesis/export protein